MQKEDAEVMSSRGHWFALYTKPHKEYMVSDFLSAQKVEVYLPEIDVKTRRRDRRAKRPFFPHYLFARLDPENSMIAKLRWTPGLRSIVSRGGRPVPVPDQVVQKIRHRLATVAQAEPEGPFRQGDGVRIMHGPFKGLDAVFDRTLSAKGRVRVFLEWMSRRVSADLDLDDLAPPR